MWSSRRKISNSLISLIIFGLFVAANGASRIRRILGGVPAGPSEFTFVVRLESTTGTETDTCGGVIITEQHVLTAAHCLEDTDRVVVLCGLVSATDNASQTIAFKEKFIHHRYREFPPQNVDRNRNDIAIGVLENALTFDRKVSKIPLTSKPLDPSKMAILAGYGEFSQIPSERGWNSLHKMSVSIWVFPNSLLEPKEFSGRNLTGDFCSGDSGSPLISSGRNPVVIGIAVRSPCKAGGRQIYTNVYEYLPWIHCKIPSLASTRSNARRQDCNLL